MLSGVAKPISARELSKQETQQRIILAARELFAAYGYDGATLRQIAAHAGLTVGALFKHATDKRDLIYLIFNEEVESVTVGALAAPQPGQSLSDKVLSISARYFRLFASAPVLSRILLVEIGIESPGLHLGRYLSNRARLLDGLERLVGKAQAAGEIRSTEAAEFIALQIFVGLAACLRRWLAASARPQWRAGQREFERLLNLQMSGLGTAPWNETAAHPGPEDVSAAVRTRG